MTSLFEPVKVGAIELPNRIVMAPLTRNRSVSTVPNDLNVEYYRQRASAALILSEGTQPSAVGQGYYATPGLHDDEQQAGWARIAEAVHADGGHLFVQLMHVGRIAHPDNKNGIETVAPSAIAAPGEIVTPTGSQPYPVPRELETDELAGVVAEYVDSARRAVAAGLDGVELHSANGYLLHQFLSPVSNTRTDAYGGSPEHRVRFVLEVARAVAAEIGGDRVGIRISPAHNIQGVLEQDPVDVAATYGLLVDGISSLGLAYLHVLGEPSSELVRDLRSRFDGPFIGNDGFSSITTLEKAQQLVDDGLADLVAVGRLFLANPDLPRRWQTDAALNEPNPATFYGGAAEGYTDYPALGEA